MFKPCCDVFFPKETEYGTVCVNCDVIIPSTFQPKVLKELYIEKGKLNACCDAFEPINEGYGTVCINCGKIVPKSISFGKDIYMSRDKGQHGHVDVLLNGYNRTLGTSIKGSFKHKQLVRRFLESSSDNKNHQNYLNKRTLESLLPNVPEKFINKTTDEFNSLNLFKENKNEKNSFKGNRKKGLQAVCLYFSYQFFGEFIQKQDICEQLNIKPDVFSNGKKLYFELKRKNNKLRSYTKIVDEEDLNTVCHSVCVTCGIHQQHEHIILLCFTTILKYGICPRHTNRSVLYAVVYYFLKDTDRIDKIKHVEKNGFIAISTMKKIYKLIKQYEQIIIWGCKKISYEKKINLK